MDKTIVLSIFLVHLVHFTSALAINVSDSEWFGNDDQTLSRYEQMINACLMCSKEEETEAANNAATGSLPATNFLDASEDIEKSDVFQMIQRMPKGAAVHVHHKFMVHGDWLYNASFEDNLYICDNNGEFVLKFLKQPTRDCNWKSMNKMRENPVVARALNNRIWRKMTMLVKNPNRAYPNPHAAWTKLKDISNFIDPLLTYKPVAEAHFYYGLQELYDDKVIYLELRSPIPKLYDLNGKTYNKLEVLGILENVTERFKEDHPGFIGAKIIYTRSNEKTKAEVRKFLDEAVQLKKAYPNFIAGLDFTGQDEKTPHLNPYLDDLKKVRQQMRVFFDARKAKASDPAGDKNLLQALSLNATRIGHGYPIINDPKMLEYVKNQKSAVEICPISNQMLKYVNDIRKHPAAQLLDKGIPMVICNDDPSVWGAKALSYDFYEAFMGFMSKDADLRALKQLAKNSIIYSSLSPEEKAQALAAWQKKWIEFIKEYVEEEAKKKK
ncbi:adenosine deaminase 2-like [Diachasmimorpha longicaudata]|uniref:adenosine deaminase 2-like n=1 Tax=Diachasmimorpha longicaudata TaxID=58733 RepID=UPI0030B8DD9D